MTSFKNKLQTLFEEYEQLITRTNKPLENGNGISHVINIPYSQQLILPSSGGMIWMNKQIRF